jgi:hypothetical protein
MRRLACFTTLIRLGGTILEMPALTQSWATSYRPRCSLSSLRSDCIVVAVVELRLCVSTVF